MHRLVVAILSLCLSAASAEAAVVTGAFSGTVTAGTDVGGFFGLGVGADLTNQSINGTFSYDPAAFSVISGDGVNQIDAVAISPALTITETINGVSRIFTGDVLSEVSMVQGGYGETGFAVSAETASGDWATVDEYTAYALQTLWSLAGDIGSVNFAALAGTPLIDDATTFLADDSFYAFRIASLSATVPEPAPILLLSLGLFGIGVLRLRRPRA